MDIELQADTGNSGEMIYSYYFEVPEGTSQAILDKKGWNEGEIINGIPIWVVEQ
ncbi:hypothetical protein I6M49_22025 [Shewanella algae]|uniref:hypothetical protein n=1 Tax=Shewanella algae TaxID=38313 RepID=UPI001AAD6B39|nr:hypothetical protein [Shewanella algae]MBO2656123.1 hypothetical protein [Shewanella algae]